MKTIRYSVTYNDGLKSFFEKQVDEAYDESDLSNQLYESGGIKGHIIYNSKEQYELAKKQSSNLL